MIGKSLKVLVSVVVLAIVLLMIVLFAGSRVITDYLWFQNLDYVYTFLVMFFANFGVRLVLGVIFTIFIFINLYFTKNIFLNPRKIQENQDVEPLFNRDREKIFQWINKKRLLLIYLLGSILLSFLFSSVGNNAWDIILKYFNQVSFEVQDPIFMRDVSFYVFTLPFYNFIKEIGMLLIVLTFIIVGALYLLGSGINSVEKLQFNLPQKAKSHLTILVTLFLFLKAWDYRLSMFDLLYSDRGVVMGASYTDINANLIGLWILLFIALAIGILFLFSLFKKNYKMIFWGLGIWIGISLVFSSIYPGIVQRFQVKPNELEREREFIDHNIDMTLNAYNLNDISNRDFEVDNDLTSDDLNNNLDIINNIRLWDYRPKLATYGQLQELRPYYSFQDVDVDRYQLNGNYQQVMLSARELDKNKLPSRTWVNEKLIYTHGYGLAMSPVNRVISNGLPDFLISDLPAQTETDIELNNMALYYGEMTDDYVIANTRAREFHYSRGGGEENVYRSYTGHGGVKVSSFLRKAMFSLRFGDSEIILTDAIDSDSRIMFHRNIKQRVRRIAPFLKYDQDPYLAVADGRMYWILDAYTTSSRYPYSTPYNQRDNYIRNSVKVIIDAYQGDVDFYIVDEEDPMVQTYNNIFPDLFSERDEIPDNLQQHLRYPQDLFNIQSQLYRIYHMQDPDVFYNQEDLWDIPTEKYGQSNIQMEPYYVLNRLQDNETLEFLLMLPFTPSTRNNMISWMAARSDGEHYGELVVYDFPEGELVYGPQQIESRIDQNPEISQQLSLWGQRGSRVIRGNLLVIPIESSILYVEPIYIESEETKIPELRRVIVSFAGRIVMAPTLEQGLVQIFGEYGEETIEEEIDRDTGEQPAPQITEAARKLSSEAADTFEEMISAQQEGNWARYGELIDELEDIINRMENIEEESQEDDLPEDDSQGEIIEDEIDEDEMEEDLEDE